jgi:hypothetical protein
MTAIRCPHCQAVLTMAAPQRGQAVVCDQCGNSILLPAALTEIQTPDLRIDPPPAVETATPLPPRESVKEPGTALPAFRPGNRKARRSFDESGAFRDEMARFTGSALPDITRVGAAPVPPNAQLAIETLGAPIASLERPANPNRGSVIGGVVLVAMGLGHGVLGSLDFALNPRPEPAFAIHMVSVGVALAAVGILLVVFRKRTPLQIYWVCPDGLIWQWGPRIEYCRWDEVARFSSSVVADHAVYWLSPRRGVDLVLRSSLGRGAMLLAEYIELRASAAQLPLVLNRIRRGQRVAFRKLFIDLQGLHAGRATCPWDEISGIHVDATTFRVDGEGRRGLICLRALDVSFPLVVQAVARIMSDESSAA